MNSSDILSARFPLRAGRILLALLLAALIPHAPIGAGEAGDDLDADLVVFSDSSSPSGKSGAKQVPESGVAPLAELTDLVLFDDARPSPTTTPSAHSPTPLPRPPLPEPSPSRPAIALDRLQDLVLPAEPAATEELEDDLVVFADGGVSRPTESAFPGSASVVDPVSAEPAAAPGVGEASPPKSEAPAPFSSGKATADFSSPPAAASPVPDVAAWEDDLVILEPAPRPAPGSLPGEAPVDFSPSLPRPAEIAGKARADFAAIESRCRSGETAEARAIFESLPPFGGETEFNRIRADALNLLVLNYGLDGDIAAAERMYAEFPDDTPSGAATGRVRAILNLATFFVRTERLNEAYDIFLELEAAGHPDNGVDNDLFKLAARMIPYLDNGGEHDKAGALYDHIRARAETPGALPHFCAHVPAVTRYLLAKPSIVASTPDQDRRAAFMERIYDSFAGLGDGAEVRELRRQTAAAMLHFYTITGNVLKARGMEEELARLGGEEGRRIAR